MFGHIAQNFCQRSNANWAVFWDGDGVKPIAGCFNTNMAATLAHKTIPIMPM